MSVARELIDRYFETSGGELVVGGVAIGELASEFGTPLFVYDEGVLDAKWSALRSALPDRVEIFYSVKANPNPHVLRKFVANGAGLEIASAGELSQALSSGIASERIVFAGPGKSDDEIREFLRVGGGEIHVESSGEATRLARLCDEADVQARAAIRINPSAEAQGGAMRMGGKPTAFGVDEESMEDVIAILRAAPRVTVTGVHIFAGTQILDTEILGAQYRKCLELAERVADYLGEPVQTVDFGGGLGVPYFDGETMLDVARYGDTTRAILDGAGARFETTRFLVEPGRFLTAEAGVYAARVVDVKRSRGKTFVVLDGGMNHHLAASGNLGQVIRRNFPMAVVSRLDEPASGKADVVGPLCTPLDLLGRQLDVPNVQTGDLVGVFQSGAYARTASPLGFLSHRSPAEVLVRDGAPRLIRRRGRYEDIVADVP